MATAQLLTDSEVGVVDDLREHVRDTTDVDRRLRRAVTRGVRRARPCRRTTGGSRSLPAATASCAPSEGILAAYGARTSCWSATAPPGPCWRRR